MSNCLVIVTTEEDFLSDNTKHVLSPLIDLIKSGIIDSVVVYKFTDSIEGDCIRVNNQLYSFEENNSELVEDITEVIKKDRGTGIDENIGYFLENKCIDKVFITGVNTDCYVLKTALDVNEFGMRSIVLSDYCATILGDVQHKQALEEIKELLGDNNVVGGIITLDNLVGI